MKISLCNEVLRDLQFAEQCSLASDLGYEGLEIAPFTLSQEPHLIPDSQRRELRRQAEQVGLEITGLHWLLRTPKGLSVTSAEESVRRRTREVLTGLVHLCADLGGKVLVHGSPQQRIIHPEQDRPAAEERARELFQEIAVIAEQVDVTYCIEPLTRAETNYINSLEEAVALVEQIGNPHLKTMLDTRSARSTETEPVEGLIARWLPGGSIAHVHVNDRNLRGPGQGEDRFAAFFQALLAHRYDGLVSVEPFEYSPNGPCTAARAIGYIQGILETSKLEN